MQAIHTVETTNDATLAGDLYALVVFLHKNCNADLFEAVGTLELSLSQIKLLQHLEDQPRELSLKRRPRWSTCRCPPPAGWSTTSSGVGSRSGARMTMTAG